MATLHQPSSDIFHMADDLFLMSEGGILYQGPTAESVPYFANLGYTCFMYSNPADFFFMNVLNQEGSEDGTKGGEGESEEEINTGASPGEMEKAHLDSLSHDEKSSGQDRVKALREKWLASEAYGNLVRDIATEGEKALGYEKSSRKYRSTFMTQFPVMMKRAFSNALRNKMIIRVKLVQAIILAVVIDIIFWKIPHRGDDAQVQDRAGVLFFYVMNMIMGNAMGILAVFSKERAVFEREYQSGMYSLPAYFLSKTMVELPFLILIPLFFAVITYFAIGLRMAADRFFIAAVVIIIVANVGTGMGLWAACSFKALEIALALVPVMILPLMMFSGLFVNLDDVPAWIRWFKWVSPIKYGYVALMTNEFEGTVVAGKTGEEIMRQMGLSGQGSLAVNIIALLGFWVVLWSLAYLGLWRLVASSRKNVVIRRPKSA